MNKEPESKILKLRSSHITTALKVERTRSTSPFSSSTIIPMKAPRLSYAQGDVLLIPVDAIPPSATRPLERKQERLILAYGEVTGHAHRIDSPNVDAYIAPDDTVWLDVRNLVEEVNLKHGYLDGRPENPNDKPHDPIVLPPGKYRVVPGQREFVAPKGLAEVIPARAQHSPD